MLDQRFQERTLGSRRSKTIRGFTVAAVVLAAIPSMGNSGCSGGAGADTAGTGSSLSGAPTSVIPPTSASGATGVASAPSSSINAIQIITKADSTGSFDSVSVPLSGGQAVKASRVFNLDGSQITVGNVPTWFVEARVFLTSTRTSAGTIGSQPWETPCAYFDADSSDVNPDQSGFYTIDGYNTDTDNNGSPDSSDIDQCAGTAASELNQLGMYVRVDRRFMAASDRLQVIVKAKPINSPNTTVTPSSCTTSGFFDPSACVNQLFTLTMRTLPTAPSKPFYILFPTAKALDFLSESVLMPINIDQSITTISLDRVKGGAVIYGMSVIRLQ